MGVALKVVVNYDVRSLMGIVQRQEGKIIDTETKGGWE